MWTSLLKDLRRTPWYQGQIVHQRTLPATSAQFGIVTLPSVLQAYLDRQGISLYKHQIESIDAFRHGSDIVITTPTASGKTLAFNLPVLETLAKDSNATALYLYPLKALANDQLGKLRELDEACGLDLNPNTYDGDTPAGQRKRLREKSRIILTNAHALHQ